MARDKTPGSSGSPKPNQPKSTKPKRYRSKQYRTLAGEISRDEILAANVDRETKVRFIMSLMRNLRWETGETLAILAEVWGQSKKMVEHYSSEASRRVRAEIQDPEFVSNTVTSSLLACLRDATRAQDRRSIISAAKTWAEISANLKAQEKEASNAATLTDEELEKLAKEAIELLRQKK
jgi:hypothetical protein